MLLVPPLHLRKIEFFFLEWYFPCHYHVITPCLISLLPRATGQHHPVLAALRIINVISWRKKFLPSWIFFEMFFCQCSLLIVHAYLGAIQKWEQRRCQTVYQRKLIQQCSQRSHALVMTVEVAVSITQQTHQIYRTLHRVRAWVFQTVPHLREMRMVTPGPTLLPLE